MILQLQVDCQAQAGCATAHHGNKGRNLPSFGSQAG